MNWPFLVTLAISVVALLAAGVLAVRSLRAPHSRGRRKRSADPDLVFPVRSDVRPLPDPVPPAPAVPTPPPPAAVPDPAPPPVAAAAPAASEVVEGHTIRFYRPPGGTLQLLPGRLEIVDGLDQGQEIRFVRAHDGVPEVTFGRSSGPPHRHIQLRASTVSREHALMRLDGGRWMISNLSRTNPVVLNGEELRTTNGGHPLQEGDRIEMGEVIFLFRER